MTVNDIRADIGVDYMLAAQLCAALLIVVTENEHLRETTVHETVADDLAGVACRIASKNNAWLGRFNYSRCLAFHVASELNLKIYF